MSLHARWYDCPAFQEACLTVLVTGGAGIIGANFVLEWLSVEDRPIVNLDKLTYAGNMQSLAAVLDDQRHTIVQADIADSETVSELLDAHRPRAIVHCAADSHVDCSISGPDDFMQTNVLGTFRLLDASRQYFDSLSGSDRDEFRFINVSTDEVYRSLEPQAPAFAETHRYSPNSPYSASKASADHIARSYFHTYGLPVITSNCSNNYGPLQFLEKLIPLMIMNDVRGKPLPIYGDELNVRDWLYVGDHCATIRLLLEQGKPGETYNIGGDSEMTNLDVVDEICSLLDELVENPQVISHKQLISYIEDRPGHDKRYAVNSDKIKIALAWEASETFQSGLRKTVQWYLNNEDWIAEVESGEYRTWVDSHYGQGAVGQ